MTKRNNQCIHIFITWQDGRFNSFILFKRLVKFFCLRKKEEPLGKDRFATKNLFLHCLGIFAVFTGHSSIKFFNTAHVPMLFEKENVSGDSFPLCNWKQHHNLIPESEFLTCLRVKVHIIIPTGFNR